MDIPRPDIRLKKRHRRVTIGGLAAVAAISTTLLLARLDPPAPIVARDSVRIDTVKRGEMPRLIRGHGVMSPGAAGAAAAEARAAVRFAVAQAGEIHVGQAARLEFSGQRIAARVVQVDAAPVNGSIGVTLVPVSPGEAPLGAATAIDATIELERLQGVVYVGRPGFGREQDTVWMFRLDLDRAHAVRTLVKLGRGSSTLMEIQRGLVPGDRVILSDMSQYADRIRLN